MTIDEPGTGVALDEMHRPAARLRSRFMSGFLIGLAVQAGAVGLFAVLAAVGPKGCYAGYTASIALYITIIVDAVAGVITFWRVTRSNPDHRRAVAAGMALSYLLALVAVIVIIVTWAMAYFMQFGCAD